MDLRWNKDVIYATVAQIALRCMSVHLGIAEGGGVGETKRTAVVIEVEVRKRT